jgi:dTDP-4-amino-4,6-dideoxygalactose transaminase
MTYRIPLSYNPIDVPALVKVLNEYETDHHNQIVVDFERSISTLTKVPHVVAVNSGTAAIHLSLLTLGVGSGDVVIAPTFTYIATINPILYVGATPVLVDCEPETWNMDPALLMDAITSLKKRGIIPKAIMVVHTYGMPAKMDEIMAIAANEGIPIIEDAAESLGASYKENMTGTMGSIGIYSFNNNKAVTTYGGGAFITRNGEWATKARFLASQARENRPYYEHQTVGFNYLMSPLNAAMGLSEIQKIHDKNESRRQIFSVYQVKLSEMGTFQNETNERLSNRWLSTILFKDVKIKNMIISTLNDNSIETRPLWKPMHLQPLYRNIESCFGGRGEKYFNNGLCLPSGFKNEMEQAEVVKLMERLHTRG